MGGKEISGDDVGNWVHTNRITVMSIFWELFSKNLLLHNLSAQLNANKNKTYKYAPHTWQLTPEALILIGENHEC